MDNTSGEELKDEKFYIEEMAFSFSWAVSAASTSASYDFLLSTDNSVSQESHLADVQRPEKLPLRQYIQGWNITRNVNW